MKLMICWPHVLAWELVRSSNEIIWLILSPKLLAMMRKFIHISPYKGNKSSSRELHLPFLSFVLVTAGCLD